MDGYRPQHYSAHTEPRRLADRGYRLSVEPSDDLRIEFWHDTGCPNAGPVRARLMDCLAQLKRPWSLCEHVDEGKLSPTLLVNGADVVADRAPAVGCRLDSPTHEQIWQALQTEKGARC